MSDSPDQLAASSCPVTGHAAPPPHPAALPSTGPNVRFFQVYPDAAMPMPARNLLPNALPSIATRKCPPVTTASSLGWIIAPPVSFAVRWMGDYLEWARIDDEDGSLGDWEIVGEGRAGTLPDHLAQAAAGVPEDRRADLAEALGEAPYIDPNLHDAREFQLVTGLLAVTDPGWAMLVRGVPNRPRQPDGYDIVEGVVESAWYGTPMFVMVRLREVGRVVRFSAYQPMATLVPIAVASYARENASAQDCDPGIGNWPQEVWDRFVASRRAAADGVPVSYKRAQREYYRGQSQF